MEPPIRILLIEDDPAIARALREGLAREGYAVEWKSTGADGEIYVHTHNPQLIILDVRLPDGSGFDVCRRLRQAGHHQPILILTVRSDEIDKVLGLEMGADNYLTKPFGLRELLSRVRSCGAPIKFRLIAEVSQSLFENSRRLSCTGTPWRARTDG